MLNLNRIADALSALLHRTPGDAFVIFEEKGSGKFVQFARSPTEPLYLDLPAQTLSEEEMKRAKVLFAELGVSGPKEYEVYTDPTMREVTGTQISFNMDFGQDFQRATEVTLAIFERVYKFPPDFQLVLKEN